MGNNGELYRPLKTELIKVIDESPLIKTFVLVPEQEFSFDTGPVSYTHLTLPTN